MARLIDADALDKRYKIKVGEWRGNGILPSMECLMWIAAESMLADAPTVEAIPVEWLRRYTAVGVAPTGDRLTEGDERLVIHRILNEWQKEQEAQDG